MIAVTLAERGLFGSVLSAVDDVNTAAAPSSFVDRQAADFVIAGGVLSSDDQDAATLWFVNDWLGAIADASVGLFLVQLASIPILSRAGCLQLRVDIEYIR